MVREKLGRRGYSDQEVDKIVDNAEESYEERCKISEAEKELDRLMQLKKDGYSLMRVNGKWRPVKFNKGKNNG